MPRPWERAIRLEHATDINNKNKTRRNDEIEHIHGDAAGLGIVFHGQIRLSLEALQRFGLWAELQAAVLTCCITDVAIHFLGQTIIEMARRCWPDAVALAALSRYCAMLSSDVVCLMLDHIRMYNKQTHACLSLGVDAGVGRNRRVEHAAGIALGTQQRVALACTKKELQRACFQSVLQMIG